MSKFFAYVPIVIGLLWLMYLTAYQGLTRVSNGTLPDLPVFLLSMLMLVGEIADFFDRRTKLKEYFFARENGEWELEPLHWSDRTLRWMTWGESAAYLILVWSLMILLVGLSEFLLQDFVEMEIRSWVSLGIMLGVILGGRRAEKWWDQYARKQFWLPW